MGDNIRYYHFKYVCIRTTVNIYAVSLLAAKLDFSFMLIDHSSLSSNSKLSSMMEQAVLKPHIEVVPRQSCMSINHKLSK